MSRLSRPELAAESSSLALSPRQNQHTVRTYVPTTLPYLQIAKSAPEYCSAVLATYIIFSYSRHAAAAACQHQHAPGYTRQVAPALSSPLHPRPPFRRLPLERIAQGLRRLLPLPAPPRAPRHSTSTRCARRPSVSVIGERMRADATRRLRSATEITHGV